MSTQETISSEEFRHAMASVPAFLFLTDREGACTYVSEAWGVFTGEAADRAGEAFWDCCHPEDRPRLRAALTPSSDTPRAFSFYLRLRRHDGAYRWCLCAGHPRFDRAGAPAGYSATMVDVHERKSAEVTMAEREAYFQKVVDCSPAILWINNAEGRCVYLSRTWFEFTGREADRDLN